MRRFVTLLACWGVFAISQPAATAAAERRLALVIGNASYAAKPLPTTGNDAALVARTLQVSGFEVTSLRDANEENLRKGFHDFFGKVKSAGPDAVAAVYFAGLGLQFGGENYLLPIDADISEPTGLSRHALPLSEQMHALAGLGAKASFVILDSARTSPFLLSGRSPANGFAWTEPDSNVLLAFSAAPGTIARDGTDGYGPYAVALAEMIQRGGLGPEDLFDDVRLRVVQLTGGAQVPWDAANIQTRFKFAESGEPSRADSRDRIAWMRAQPMRRLGADDAFWVALLRDTCEGYAEFLAEYGNDPMAKRVEVLLAARRESITWRRSNEANMPDAYWTYLERYPHGPHVADAEQLLTQVGAATTPPPKFRKLDYDVPPPLPAELELFDQPVLSLNDPASASAPLKILPDYLLQAPPSELRALEQKIGAAATSAALKPPPIMPSPQSPKSQPIVSTAAPTAGNAIDDGARSTPGQGRPSGAVNFPIEPASSAQMPVLQSTSATGSSVVPAVPGALEARSLPAWASLSAKDSNTSGIPTFADKKSIRTPLFVSAALAEISDLSGHRPFANARTGTPTGAPAPVSDGLARGTITGSLARPSSPKAALLPADGRARTSPGQQQRATGAAALLTTRAGRLSERTLSPQGEPERMNRLPGTRPEQAVTSRPAASAAPSPKAADQAAQITARTSTLKPGPKPSPPSETSAASSPQSNPCTLSGGRLNCGDSR